MAMNQSCYALTSNAIDPALVHFYALSAVRFLKHKAPGAVFDAIVTRDFNLETIDLLPEDIQNEATQILKSYLDMIHINQEEILSLSEFRDSLLPRLMSGEVDLSVIDF